MDDRLDGAAGSRFWISIPFQPDHNSMTEKKSKLSKHDSLSTTPMDEKPRLRILLVDDSILIRKATSRSLIQEGHDVELAQHGEECLRILERSKPSKESSDFAFDLILMDIQMPVMGGLEATRCIRAMEESRMLENSGDGGCAHSRIMIIGYSANTAVDAEVGCIESGMDGFIEKPLKMSSLQEYFTRASLASKR